MDESECKTTVRAHSVKVPRVYKIAASILSAYFRGEGSIKDLVYNQPKKKRHPRVNAILALTSEAVRNEKILTKLFSATHYSIPKSQEKTNDITLNTKTLL